MNKSTAGARLRDEIESFNFGGKACGDKESGFIAKTILASFRF